METVILTPVSNQASEICKANGLDFTISKRPLFDCLSNPSGYFGLWNDSIGKCIHTVKAGYHVSQNQEVIEMVLKGIEPFSDFLRVQKAGVINEGRKVFIQLEIEGTSRVANDIIKRYITIIDSNDGSTSLSVGIGDLTMSCQNQFWKFYRKGNKMRHSVSLEQKLKELPKLIETALEHSLVQIELYNKLANTPIVDYSLIDKMVNKVLGFDKTSGSIILEAKSAKSIEKMAKLYDAIRTEMNGKGLNLWGLHSGVTRFTTHDVEHKAKRENIRIESQLTGSSYDMNQNSLDFVTGLLPKAKAEVAE
jgi:hypothetical protein